MWAVRQNGLEVFVCVLALGKLHVLTLWASGGQSTLDCECQSLRRRVVLFGRGLARLGSRSIESMK